jgi:hypothetical protein
LAYDGVVLLFHSDDLSKGNQVLYGKLWLLDSDEVGCGELITTHEHHGSISQGSIIIP